VFGYYEYRLDLGLNDLPVAKEYTSDTVWSAGAEYMLSRNVSLMGSYDNRFGAGGGVVCQILKSIGINLFTSWIYSIEIIISNYGDCL
jgi:hypothetical protein